MSLDFTVAIPVYNGARRVPEVLAHLQSQAGVYDLNWEILIVDNNSSDNLLELIQECQRNWESDVPLRYCFEAVQGLAYARERAIQEAKANLIGFLDDDNLPDPDWVLTAVQFAQTHPKAGAFGGQIRAKYDAQPPVGFDQVKSFLVIRRYGQQAAQFQPERLRLPAGAGLVVRKEAWIESVPSQLICVKSGGEDYEISLRMYRHGWEIWYCPEMRLTHHIPVWRFEKAYLTTLAYGYGCCTCDLRMLITPHWQKPYVLIRGLLGSLYRIVLCSLRHHQILDSDLAIACQLAFLRGNVVGPFIYLRDAAVRAWGASRQFE